MKRGICVATFLIAARTLSAQGDNKWLLIPDIVPRVKRGLSKLVGELSARMLGFQIASL